jgi:hypothetical protein
MKIYYNTNTVNFNCNTFPRICRYPGKKWICSLCTRGPARRIVWKNKMKKMEKFWMIQSILNENETSKHHAFTKETLYDDGDWFKAVPSNSINSTVWNVKSLTQKQNLRNYSITALKRTFPSRTVGKKLELQMVSDYLQYLVLYAITLPWQPLYLW